MYQGFYFNSISNNPWHPYNASDHFSFRSELLWSNKIILIAFLKSLDEEITLLKSQCSRSAPAE